MIVFNCRCKTTDVKFKCDEDIKANVNASRFCGELVTPGGAFTQCIKTLPDMANQFYSSCVFDVCSFQGSKDFIDKAKCYALEGFAEECAENGITVKWRRKGFCGKSYMLLGFNLFVFDR